MRKAVTKVKNIVQKFQYMIKNPGRVLGTLQKLQLARISCTIPRVRITQAILCFSISCSNCYLNMCPIQIERFFATVQSRSARSFLGSCLNIGLIQYCQRPLPNPITIARKETIAKIIQKQLRMKSIIFNSFVILVIL